MTDTRAGDQLQRPPVRRGLVLGVFAALFAIAALYGLLSAGLGQWMILVTVVVGFGLPVLLWLAMEWVAPPLVAVFAGWTARYFPILSLALGIPLVLAYTYVSPVAMGGSSDFSVPLPWLSVPKARAQGLGDLLLVRAQMWLAVYGGAYVLAYLSRILRPPPSPPPAAARQGRPGDALDEAMRRHAENKRILMGGRRR